MTCEIINVGTELLLGNILNTNARFLAGELQALGISCYHQTVVGDNEERLCETLRVALSRCDLVITTGGLGPTYDDITKTGVTKVLGVESKIDEASLEHCKSYYKSAGKEFTDNNLQQAMMPVGATVFTNEWGTANALAVEKDGKIVILLPGPPRELEPIFHKHVWPYLEAKTGDKIVKRKVRCFDVWEAHIEAKLRPLMTSSANPSVAPYAGNGEVLLQVTARAKTAEEARAMTEPAIAQIRRTLQDNVYGVDVDSLEEVVISLLKEQKATLAVAESCTGGLLAKRITDVAGASEVFLGGAVTYANELKMKLLGVKPETIEQYGAVSRQTAEEMAIGIQKLTGATYAIATTGIAGPGGGTKAKPVGLVYFGIANERGAAVYDVRAGREGSDRAYVRTLACSHALNMLRLTLQGLI